MGEEERKKGWTRCTGQLFGTCKGWMVPWTGSDGHNGTETFYTCNKCGRTG